MPKNPAGIRPDGGEAGKWHSFYTGPGYQTTKDDVLKYGESVGMDKVYWATDASNFSGNYNGDTFVLYGDKENLPEAMRKDAEREEERNRLSREAETKHMVISVGPSQIDEENQMLRVPLVQNDKPVTGFVSLKNITLSERKDGWYDADLGTRAVQHDMVRPGCDREPISAQRIKNMVDNARAHAVAKDHRQWREHLDSIEPVDICDIREEDLPF